MLLASVVIDHLAAVGFDDESLTSAGRFNQLRWLVREMAAVDGVEGTVDFAQELSPTEKNMGLDCFLFFF